VTKRINDIYTINLYFKISNGQFFHFNQSVMEDPLIEIPLRTQVEYVNRVKTLVSIEGYISGAISATSSLILLVISLANIEPTTSKWITLGVSIAQVLLGVWYVAGLKIHVACAYPAEMQDTLQSLVSAMPPPYSKALAALNKRIAAENVHGFNIEEV
jgi:hypothetical protein